MSKLDNILNEAVKPKQKREFKALILELIGAMEERETEDMMLKSWTAEDQRAFGRNTLRSKIIKKVEKL